MQPRLPPTQPSAEEMAFRQGEGTSPPNLQLVIAHAPEIARLQLELNRAATAGMSSRQKELIILVAGLQTQNEYCWGHHVPLAVAAGISEAEIRAIRRGDYSSFQPEEHALLRFTAAVVSQQVTDELWAQISKKRTHEELVKVVMLTSFYCMMGTLRSALNVPQDAGFGGFELPLS